MFGPFYGKSTDRFITKAPLEVNTMGSITDRFNNVSQQTFRAAVASPEAMLELKDAVQAFLVTIEAALPAPPVAEKEWLPPASPIPDAIPVVPR
jgi:hypothetical protein